jgi:error-prone DNA polymerase
MLKPIPAYAELHCLSNFSFLRGASHAQELADRAAELGYRALAVTDECSLAGVVRAHGAAKSAGLPLIIGSEMQLCLKDGSPWCTIVLLAQNRNGYGNLSELITLGRRRAQKGAYRLHLSDIDSASGEMAHLRGMPDCLALLIPDRTAEAEAIAQQAHWLKRTFGERCWLAVELLMYADDGILKEKLMAVSQATGITLVAAGNVQMHVRSRKLLHDTLTAIRLGKPIGECGFALARNAEQHLRARVQLARLYPAQWLAETVTIAESCRFSLDELRYEYPEEIVPPGQTPAGYLRSVTVDGARERFPNGVPANVLALIEHELALISELKYEAYFLTVYDIVKFARSQNILCQGRGSAANSAVCYCLGVTAIDPARATLLFERFVSRERDEPPDIDIDFEHERREEVIQYIYEKYGRHRAALAAAVSTYRSRGAIRDVGKALGIDLPRIDMLAKSFSWWDGRKQADERLAELGFDPQAMVTRQWIELVDVLINFPRHLSQHVGGFVISRGPLCRLVPIENAAMQDRCVIQWDKDDLESLGLLKVDVLALGMLTALRRALDFIGQQRGTPMKLTDIPSKDPAVFEMACRADTIGVFQIESRAQMSMLPRLQPRVFYDLVVQVAIVRPGPIQGGMVHPFLRRRQGLEPVEVPAGLEPALERTLGVPIFQEQVMQIAMLGAGFTSGEADALRRAMAAWKRKGGLDKFQDKIVKGMKAKGYEEDFALRICKQIEGFGEYGFPESHAASFALLVYASCWVKHYHPAAFLASLLNSQPMGFYAPAQLVQDAQRHGVEVRPPDVTVSDWHCSLEAFEDAALQPAVRLGLCMVKGLNKEAVGRIVARRGEAAFADADDLGRRAELSRLELRALAAANALAALTGHRRNALWQVSAHAPQPRLLRQAPIREAAVDFEPPTEGQDIVADYHSIGLSNGRHPLALLRPRLAAMGLKTAAELRSYPSRRLARACGIVTVRQRPGTAKGVIFITIEDETGPVNVIVWSHVLQRQRREVLSAPLIAVYGVWQSESGVQHLVAQRIVDRTPLLGSLQTRSRDFH